MPVNPKTTLKSLLTAGFYILAFAISTVCLNILPGNLLAQEIPVSKLQTVFATKLIGFVERDGFKQNGLKICLEEFRTGPRLQDFSEFSSTYSVPVEVFGFKDIQQARDCSIIISNKHVRVDESSNALKIALNAEECDSASHIRLFVEANKLRFAVNIMQAKNDRFQLSSKLLTLAKIEEC